MFQFRIKPVAIALLFSAFVPMQASAQDLPPEPASESPRSEGTGLPAAMPDALNTGDTSAKDSNAQEDPNAQEDSSPQDSQKTVSDTLEKQSSKPVVDGPLKDQRQALYDQIQTTEASGIGIKNYMMAFNYIEDMAAKGESEEAIKKRMVPLVSALANQLKTKQYLKNRPKSQASASGDLSPLLAPNQKIPDQLRRYGGLGGSHTNDLIKQIVSDERLKGKIPKNLNKGNLREKLNDPRVQELIKKYKDKF